MKRYCTLSLLPSAFLPILVVFMSAEQRLVSRLSALVVQRFRFIIARLATSLSGAIGLVLGALSRFGPFWGVLGRVLSFWCVL